MQEKDSNYSVSAATVWLHPLHRSTCLLPQFKPRFLVYEECCPHVLVILHRHESMMKIKPVCSNTTPTLGLYGWRHCFNMCLTRPPSHPPPSSLLPPPGTPPALSSRPPPLPLVASIAGRSASWVCCLEAPERPGWPRQTRSSVLSEKRDTKRKQLVSFHLSRHVCSVRKQKQTERKHQKYSESRVTYLFFFFCHWSSRASMKGWKHWV